jgi:hypothetical protein
MKMWDLIQKEARSEEEKAFLGAELSLELAEVNPMREPGCLPPGRVRRAVRKLIRDIKRQTGGQNLSRAPGLAGYVDAAFGRALR